MAKPADIPDDKWRAHITQLHKNNQTDFWHGYHYVDIVRPIGVKGQFSSVEWTIPCYCITIVYIYCTHVASVGVSAVVPPWPSTSPSPLSLHLPGDCPPVSELLGHDSLNWGEPQLELFTGTTSRSQYKSVLGALGCESPGGRGLTGLMQVYGVVQEVRKTRTESRQITTASCKNLTCKILWYQRRVDIHSAGISVRSWIWAVEPLVMVSLVPQDFVPQISGRKIKKERPGMILHVKRCHWHPWKLC